MVSHVKNRGKTRWILLEGASILIMSGFHGTEIGIYNYGKQNNFKRSERNKYEGRSCVVLKHL